MIERHAEVAIVSALSVVAVAGAYSAGHTDGLLSALEPSRNPGEFVLAAEKPAVVVPDVIVPEPSAPLPSLDEINAEVRARAGRLPPRPSSPARRWAQQTEAAAEPRGQLVPVGPPPEPIVIVREAPVTVPGPPVPHDRAWTLRFAPLVSIDDGRAAFGASLHRRVRGRVSVGLETMRAGGQWYVGGGVSIGFGQ
jgi:hypothetical protein